MKRVHAALLLGGLFFVCMVASLSYGLFHGYFDRGHFEVLQTSSSADKQLAIVAKRWDNDALNNNEYFVLIGDHMPSSRELRHAYYYNQILFRGENDCLNVSWRDKRTLVISSLAGCVGTGEPVAQKHQNSGLTVVYEGVSRNSTAE